MQVSLLSAAASSLFLVSSLCGQNTFILNPDPGFSCCVWFDGSIRPGERTYLTTGNAQRGLAYNPATGNIILVDRAAGGGGSANISGGIYVINGATGADVGVLSTNGMFGGNFADLAVAIDDAGVIYVGNLVNDGTTSPFKLYRWLSDSGGEDPVVVFSGDPGNGRVQRWGDTMDIRGSGATTQIILGTRTSGSVLGTNVAILTTADGGATFTATTLTLDARDSATGGGIAFGTGNTFWAKNLEVPLRQFSFDLSTGQATTLRSYGSDVLPDSRTLEPLAVDTANNLLAIVDVTTGVDKVRLYSIANPANAPSLLDIREFPVNEANASTTKGYLDFGGGRLYVHNINNGLMGFLVESMPPAGPTIVTQPTPQRILAGRTLRLEVLAFPAVTYQWQRNGVNVSGATGAVLTVSNAPASAAGTYRVLVSNSGGSVTSDEVAVSVINPEDLFHLEPLWSGVPAAGNYVTATGGAGTPNERSIAYNALSNQLYVVQRSGNNYTIHVLNASTGEKLYNLKTNGIVLVVASEVSGANGIGLVAIDVADDGAIYACNASPNAGGGVTTPNPNKLFRVYRWANSDSNTLPVQIFEGDPAAQSSNFRWGDVLDARGSGLDTQIVLDNQNATARYLAILRPADSSMNTFTSTYFFQDTATPFGSSIGRTLEYGAGDTVWQKRRSAALLQSGFDPNQPQGISPVLATHTGYPASIGPVGLNLSRNVAAGINFVSATTAPDTLDLFEVSDPDNPLLLGQYNFPINRVANNNSIGRVLFAGDKVFALNGNNGLLAFRVVPGPVSPPSILRQPEDARVATGGSVTLRVITADLAAFQWQKGGSDIPGATGPDLTIANAQLSDAGVYRVMVRNDAGSTTSAEATLTVLPADTLYSLSTLWSAAPGAQPYVTATGGNTPNERNIAYHSLSNQLLVVQKRDSGWIVHVIDATSGAPLHALNTSGVEMNIPAFSGSTGIGLAGIGVADDGAIYACNMTADACGCANPQGVFRLYRWADSSPETLPTLVFQGDPAAQLTSLRWGDVLDVRGAGTATEIILDNNQGTYGAVLRPTDETLAAFSAGSFPNVYGSGFIGRSLEFGSGNSLWQKRKGSRLLHASYDLTAQTSAVITNYDNWPTTLGQVAVDLPRGLVVGLEFSPTTDAPDTVNLYDVSDFNKPLLIRKYSFPENSRPNANFIGQVMIAGNRVFAIDGNNGLAAFTIVPPAAGNPSITVARSGSNVILSWPAAATGFNLQSTATLTPPAWTAFGGTPVASGDRLTVTEDASSGMKFYRLCKDCP